MVHKEQHKRAGENYFKQSEKDVKELNKLGEQINSLDMMDTNSAKQLPDLLNKYNTLKSKFLFLTPYESMAYAYQYVKEFKHLTPKEIFKELEKDNIQINNITKKYIAMYWLIKDKI